MAPQSLVVPQQQQPQQVNQAQQLTVAAPLGHHQPHNNQDSNMSTGSSHSDKELDPSGGGATINSSPEKLPRLQTERKRKRKPTDNDNGNGPGSRGNSVEVASVHRRDDGTLHSNKGPRISIPVSAVGDKKINEYFSKQHVRNVGAKSPSAQQQSPSLPTHGSFPMYPPSPQPTPSLVHSMNPDYFKTTRSASNIVPVSSQQPALPALLPAPPVANHQATSLSTNNSLVPLSNVVVAQQTQQTQPSTANSLQVWIQISISHHLY